VTLRKVVNFFVVLFAVAAVAVPAGLLSSGFARLLKKRRARWVVSHVCCEEMPSQS
jgi:hypothetical protein